MKKLLLGLGLILLLVSPAYALNGNVACSTGAADCTVVSSSTTKGIRVAHVIVSVSTADNVTFKCGSTTVMGPIYLGATSGLAYNFKTLARPTQLYCAPGSAFVVTKGTASTPTTVWVDYDQ